MNKINVIALYRLGISKLRSIKRGGENGKCPVSNEDDNEIQIW
jgi:hypothetical protein